MSIDVAQKPFTKHYFVWVYTLLGWHVRLSVDRRCDAAAENIIPISCLTTRQLSGNSGRGVTIHGWDQDTRELTHLLLGKMVAILADDNFKFIFLNKNDRIPIRISLKFVPISPTDNKPAWLVQVMAWRRTGDKPLPELMLTQFIDVYMCY